MDQWLPVIRAVHTLAGALWIGEVIVINAILIPVASKFTGETRNQYLVTLFPMIFNLASVLSATVSVTGIFLVYYMTNGSLDPLLSGRWGISILVGGSLGILLTLFHFFMENRLAKKIGLGKQGDKEQLDDVHLKLKIVPRLGLIVILTIFFLMVNAGHGLFTGFGT